jgi:L-glyceraldehyde 3-phosphate reductase
VVATVRRLNDVAAARGQTMAQMAVAWVLHQSGVTSALIGASRPGQVEEAVAALDHLEFGANELATIDAARGD